MQHVVIVTPDIVGPVKNGGIGTACFHYARTLANAGMQVEILFTGLDLSPEDASRWAAHYAGMSIGFFSMADAPGPGVLAHGVNWHSDRSWRAMKWLLARDADYVLFQDWQGNGFWSARAKQLGMGFADTTLAVIAHSCTEWQNEGMKTFGSNIIGQSDMNWMEREAIAGVDVLVSPSRHMIDWLTKHGFALPARVELCPYTFEDARKTQVKHAVDTGHLIFFGRLETRKGLHLLGGALQKLKASGGALPRKISLLGKYASVEGVPTPVYLEGLREEFPDIEFFVKIDFDYVQAISYISSANGVVVIPSILDNLPLTVIESINNGFCFIAAATGGIPEMVDPDFLFAATVDGVAAKLQELPTLPFNKVRHLYTAGRSRKIWLEHVVDVVGEVGLPKPTVITSEAAMPPISVCIPFYRHDRYFRRLVSSFLSMELPALQLVIVDDGTPQAERQEFDGLAPELRALGHVVHSQPNAGPGAARNAGLERAKHDLLLFFDADNVPFPDMLKTLWRGMDRMNADSVAAPFIAVPPMNGMPRAVDELYRYQPSGGPLSVALFDNTLGDMTSLIRREAFEAVNGFNTNIAEPAWEDWELFFRLIGSGRRHYVYPEPLVFYTDHPNREKTAQRLFDMRSSLFYQLESIEKPALVQIAKTLAAHSLQMRERGVW